MNLKDMMSKEWEKKGVCTLLLYLYKIKEYIKLFMVIKIRKTISSGWEGEQERAREKIMVLECLVLEFM